MDYGNLSDEIKNKVFDMYMEESYESPFQEQYRYFIGRDFWISHNQYKFEEYYKVVNKLIRKEKINKIIKKI